MSPGWRTAPAARAARRRCTFVKTITYLPPGKFGQRLKELGNVLHQHFDLKAATEAIFLKRKAFDHEEEVRVVLHARQMPDCTIGPPSIRVQVDPHDLIDQITFDPRLSDAMMRVFWRYLRDQLKFSGHLGRSLLYSPEAIAIA